MRINKGLAGDLNNSWLLMTHASVVTRDGK